MSSTEKPIFIKVEGSLLDCQGKSIDPLDIANCLCEFSFINAIAIELKKLSHLKIFVAIEESNQGGKRTVGRLIYGKFKKFNYNGSIQLLGLPRFPEPANDSSIDWSMFGQLQSYQLSDEPLSNGSNQVQHDIITSWSKCLNIPKDYIDLDDNLFTLGGNLFLAGRIAYQLYQKNYPITVENLIEYPTVRSLTSHIDSTIIAKNNGTISAAEESVIKPIPRTTDDNSERKCLLSWTQRWVFIHEQLLGKGNYYYFDVSYQLVQGFTYQLIELALNQLVSSIGLLRSFVRVRGSSHYLTIAPSRVLSIPLIKVANDEEARIKIDERKANLNIITNEDTFLFDMVFIETPEVNCFTFIIHNLIVDDSSYMLFEEILFNLVQSLRSTDQSSALAQSSNEPEIDYIDYTIWVTRSVQRRLEIVDPLEDYWLERLKDLPNCSIPVNFDENNPPNEPKVQGKHRLISLSANETNGARALIRSAGTTLEILAEALIKVVIYKLTGVGDTIIKRMVTARLHPMSYEMIGHFTNMIYSRTSIAGNPTFISLLKDFHSSWRTDFNYRGYPWINLVAQTNVEHVCPAGISVIGLPEGRFVNNDQLSVKFFQVNQFAQVSFELVTCIYGLHEGKLHYCLNYNEDLLKPEAVELLVNTFEIFLRRVVTYSDRPIDDYFNIEPPLQLQQWPQQVDKSLESC